jgi:hypothetical protein
MSQLILLFLGSSVISPGLAGKLFVFLSRLDAFQELAVRFVGMVISGMPPIW